MPGNIHFDRPLGDGMKFIWTLLILSIIWGSNSVRADESSQLYAIHHHFLYGPKGVVRIMQVGIVDSGPNSCADILNGFLYGTKKSRESGRIRVVEAACTSTLPEDIQGISEGKSLQAGHYVTRSVKHDEGESTTFVDVMYGYERMVAGDPCPALEELYQKKWPDAQCVSPDLNVPEDVKPADPEDENVECTNNYPRHQARFSFEELCSNSSEGCNSNLKKYRSGIFVYCDLQSKEACYQDKGWRTIDQYFGLGKNVEILGANQKYSSMNGVTQQEFCVRYR